MAYVRREYSWSTDLISAKFEPLILINSWQWIIFWSMLGLGLLMTLFALILLCLVRHNNIHDRSVNSSIDYSQETSQKLLSAKVAGK